MVCVVFTWLLVLYAEFVVLRVILLPDIASFYSVLNLILFQALAGTTIVLAICSNSSLEGRRNLSSCILRLARSGLAVASHTRTMLTDPGAVPRGNATKENIEAMGLKAGEVRMKLWSV